MDTPGFPPAVFVVVTAVPMTVRRGAVVGTVMVMMVAIPVGVSMMVVVMVTVLLVGNESPAVASAV